MLLCYKIYPCFFCSCASLPQLTNFAEEKIIYLCGGVSVKPPPWEDMNFLHRNIYSETYLRCPTTHALGSSNQLSSIKSISTTFYHPTSTQICVTVIWDSDIGKDDRSITTRLVRCFLLLLVLFEIRVNSFVVEKLFVCTAYSEQLLTRAMILLAFKFLIERIYHHLTKKVDSLGFG